MKALLVYQLRPGQNLAHPLSGDERIGRDPGLPVCIDHAGISRRHARIRRKGDEWWIEDLGSTNGTFLNGQGISRERLRHLDVVTLGKAVDLVFMVGEARTAAAPPLPPVPDPGALRETRLDLNPDEVRRLAEVRAAFAREKPPEPEPATVVLTRRRAAAPVTSSPAPPTPPTAVPPAVPSAAPPVLHPAPSPVSAPPPVSHPAAQPAPPVAPTPVARPGRIRAVRLTAPGHAFRLEHAGSYILGRDPACGLHVPDLSVSRRHARIVLAEDRLALTLEDAGSSNGTDHNGTTLEGPVPLSNGDSIGLGSLLFEVRIEREGVGS
jgi:pSer/pThr/pTyr-binding forkhead associated (FHA) protein